jgi:hypothetical protein
VRTSLHRARCPGQPLLNSLRLCVVCGVVVWRATRAGTETVGRSPTLKSVRGLLEDARKSGTECVEEEALLQSLIASTCAWEARAGQAIAWVASEVTAAGLEGSSILPVVLRAPDEGVDDVECGAFLPPVDRGTATALPLPTVSQQSKASSAPPAVGTMVTAAEATAAVTAARNAAAIATSGAASVHVGVDGDARGAGASIGSAAVDGLRQDVGHPPPGVESGAGCSADPGAGPSAAPGPGAGTAAATRAGPGGREDMMDILRSAGMAAGRVLDVLLQEGSLLEVRSVVVPRLQVAVWTHRALRLCTAPVMREPAVRVGQAVAGATTGGASAAGAASGASSTGSKGSGGGARAVSVSPSAHASAPGITTRTRAVAAIKSVVTSPPPIGA